MAPPNRLPVGRTMTESSVADTCDGPGVTVAHPVLAVTQSSIVTTGGDHIPDLRSGSVRKFDLPAWCQDAVADEISKGALVERCHVIAGFGDHHRRQAMMTPARTPCDECGIGQRVLVALSEAVMVEACVDHPDMNVPQGEGDGLLPLVGEPMHFCPLGRVKPRAHSRHMSLRLIDPW